MNQGLTRKGRWEMSRGLIGRQNTESKFDKKWRMGDETGDYRKTEYTEPKFDKIRREMRDEVVDNRKTEDKGRCGGGVWRQQTIMERWNGKDEQNLRKTI